MTSCPPFGLSALLFLASVLSLATPGSAVARTTSDTAQIVGTVLDPDGRAVPGASVALRTAAGTLREDTTDGEGHFELDAIAPGTYTLHATAPGLAAEPQVLRLAPSERRDVRIALGIAAVNDLIVVSASPVDAPSSSTPAAMTTFTAADLQARQVESVAEALRVTPGLSVARSGTGGALTSVFPRGGESDFTLVLVDGVRMNTFGGAFDFGSLGAGDVEQLEIVRGPQSATFGADAIGGVIHVVTRSGPPTRASALLEGGSLQTARATANAAGQQGPLAWGVNVERWRSAGFTGIAPGTGERVANDDGDRTAGTGSVRVVRSAWEAGAQFRVSDAERGYPGPFGSDPNGTFDAVDRVSRGWTTERSASVRGAATISPRFRARGNVSWADLESRFRSPYDVSIAQTRRIDGRVQLDAALGQRLGWTIGGEHLDERARSTYIVGATALVPVRRAVDGFFSEARFELANRLTASTGVRAERIARRALDGSADPFAPRQALAPDTIVSWNPRAAISWFVRQASPGTFSWTRVRANAGTGIRPPDAFEIAFTDNPSLAPERSRSVDLGVEQTFFDARVVLDATYFWNDFDDLIVAVGRAFQDASRFKTDNIANARAHGLELTASTRTRAGLDVRVGYTRLDSEVLAVDGHPGQAPPPFAPGDRLIRRPRDQGWMEVLYHDDRWSAFARLGARGRVLDVDPSLGAFGGKVFAPGYTVVDAGASITPVSHVSIFGRLTNVADRHYEEVLGFPSPGRGFMVGARVATSR